MTRINASALLTAVAVPLTPAEAAAYRELARLAAHWRARAGLARLVAETKAEWLRGLVVGYATSSVCRGEMVQIGGPIGSALGLLVRAVAGGRTR